MASENETPARSPTETLEMPAATSWPFVMAVAVTLIGAGVVTNWLLTFIGLAIFLIAAAGWAWTALTPAVSHEEVEMAPVGMRARPVQEAAAHVESLRAGMPGHRMQLPEKIHPYSAGAKGGLVGAITMPVPAIIYGVVSGHGLWYPVNLLAGMVMSLPFTPEGTVDIDSLRQFRLSWLIVGLAIHLVTSIILGLIYGAILPMLPRRPILWGGVVAPLLWTGAIYSFMGVLDPALSRVVDWPSFTAAQFVYGITVGIVVVRSEQVYVTQ